MIIDELKSAETPAPSALPGHDPWETWKPQWRNNKRDAVSVHDQQEKHSPTQAAVLPPMPGRSSSVPQPAPQRRILDARLWEALTPAQQIAAQHIAHCYEIMRRGLGYSNSDWTRVRGSGGNAAALHGQAASCYVQWAERCGREKISHAMVLDVLVFGHSCRAVDRDRRVRAGTARHNLIEGLDLYCRLQGWR